MRIGISSAPKSNRLYKIFDHVSKTEIDLSTKQTNGKLGPINKPRRNGIYMVLLPTTSETHCRHPDLLAMTIELNILGFSGRQMPPMLLIPERANVNHGSSTSLPMPALFNASIKGSKALNSSIPASRRTPEEH